MQANQRYASHDVVFGLQVLRESLKFNPYHDQVMQELEYCTTIMPQRVEMQVEMRTCMIKIFFFFFFCLLKHSVMGSSSMVIT